MSSATALDEQYPFLMLSNDAVNYRYPTYVGRRPQPPQPPPPPPPPPPAEDSLLPPPSDCSPSTWGPPPPPPPLPRIAGAQWQGRLLIDENEPEFGDSWEPRESLELTVEPYREGWELTGHLFQRTDAPLVKGSFEWLWAEKLKQTWRAALMPDVEVDGLDREAVCDALLTLTVKSAEEQSMENIRNLRLRAVAVPSTTTSDGKTTTTVGLGYSTQPLGTEALNTLPQTILHGLIIKSCPAELTTNTSVPENGIAPGSKAFERRGPSTQGSYYWLCDAQGNPEASSARSALMPTGGTDAIDVVSEVVSEESDGEQA